MSVQTTPEKEPSLFDPKPLPPASAAAAPAAKPERVEREEQEPEEPALAEAADAAEEEPEVEAAGEDATEASGEEQEPKNDRKRLAEQLDALRKKEAELLRALAVADHPDLADAIRTIEARVYGVTRADAKIAQGLSKSEARRQETLTKKLSALKEKRTELDTQIGGLEAELQEIGAARMTDFQRERNDALQALMVALATHDSAIGAAGLDVRSLLPELGSLLPELEVIARTVSEPRADA